MVPTYSQRSLKVEEVGRKESEKEHDSGGRLKWREGEESPPAWLVLKTEGGGHQPRNSKSALEARKGKETDSFLEPPEENAAPPTP